MILGMLSIKMSVEVVFELIFFAQRNFSIDAMDQTEKSEAAKRRSENRTTRVRQPRFGSQ